MNSNANGARRARMAVEGAFPATGCGEVPRKKIVCTEADHEALTVELIATIKRTLPINTLTSVRANAWLSTMRPWNDAGLVVGECACGSTRALDVADDLGGVYPTKKEDER